MGHRKLSDAQKVFVADMAAAGYTLKNIAACAGYSTGGIMNINTASVVEEARERRASKIALGLPVLAEPDSSFSRKQMISESKMRELRDQLDSISPRPATATPAAPAAVEEEKAIPLSALIAIPLVAASENPLARKGVEIPYGLTADALWTGFIEHNRALHAAYKTANVEGPLYKTMFQRYAVQRLNADAIEQSERDEFIRTKKAEGLTDRVREVFLLVTQPIEGAQVPSRLVGEVWADHQNGERGTKHHVILTDRTAKAPEPSELFVQLAGQKKPEKLIKPIVYKAPEAA